jgi:ParB-like chromosome segregation protein Spo0J
MVMLLTEKLQTHPIADLMPSMSEEEYKNLIEDIKVNGLIEPIYLFEGYKQFKSF